MADAKRLGDAAAKYIATGDKGAFRLELEKTTKAAAETTRALSPLIKASEAFERAWQSVNRAVENGALSKGSAVKQLRDLEAAMKDQLGSAQKSEAGYEGLERVMKGVTAESKALSAAQRSVAYPTAEITKYAASLKAITDARKAGLASERDSLAQLKSLQGGMAQYADTLQEGSRELTALNRVMVATGSEQKKLEAQQQRLDAAFRADALKLYAGELKNIDARVKEIGFDAAAREVTALTADLKAQAGQVVTTGREYDQLGRLLQVAATQQDRYQKAAQAAARANDTAELRTYTSELKTLEAQLQDTAKQYGTLDSQQRALKYDPSGIRTYRTETEALERVQQDSLGAFSRVGQGLTELKGKLEAAAASAEDGTQRYADLQRLLEAVERATLQTAQAQERSQQAYRAADLSRFTTELRNIEQAQRSGKVSAEEAARAVEKLQGEFRDYAASLTGIGRELDQVTGAQRDVATGAVSLATAQERAVRSFDAAALRSFVGELQTLVREQREGSASFADTARSVEGLQGRLREYGSTLADGSREQAELNRVLELSERALSELGQSAARAGQGFDPRPVREFGTELDRLEGSGRELGSAFGTIEGDLDQLDQSLRDTGDGANLSARELGALEGVYRQLEGATERLAQAQGRTRDAFYAEDVRQQVAALADLKLALERGEISQEHFSASARNIGTALEQARSGLDANTRAYAGYTGALTRVESSVAQAEGRVRTFGVASGVTAGIGDQLTSILYRMGPAGEAMGVAMFSASAGMAGAATSAKLLNIALATTMVGALVAAAVGAVALVKNMFALDTGLTNVAKTTGFTQTELKGLAGELQQIALNTGTPIDKLLELSGVAGSLGVTGVKNVAQFTDVMNKLAIASDIVGEEGAEQLAKFINVTKDANESVGDSAELVGNVIVRLGNSLAATEAPILAMAQRLGGLKTAANVSQTDILGLAGAFVSLGVGAELGGTNVTKIFTNMSLAASRGGAELKAFADAAGLTTAEFQRLVKEQPADAFIALVEGLKRAKDAGQDINPVLQGIVGNNSEMRRVLLAAVGGFDTFTLAMNGARDEAERMTAMNNELNTRLESLRGITNLIGQSFRYAFDSLALSAIPALKGALTGVLDFTRGMIGLEQTGDRAVTFASKAGGAIGQFGKALVTGAAETDTFAANVGAGFGKAYDIVSSSVGLIRTSITTVFGGFVSAAVEGFGNMYNALIDRGNRGNTALGAIFGSLGGYVQNTVQFVGTTLAKIPSYYDAVISASGELNNSVKRIYSNIGIILGGFGLIVYGSVVEPFVRMAEPIRQGALNVIATVQNWVAAMGERFQPLVSFIRSLGINIGNFFAESADNLMDKAEALLKRGTVDVETNATSFLSSTGTIKTGFEQVEMGFTGAVNAVGDGQDAITRALRGTSETLEASVNDTDNLTAANETLAAETEEVVGAVGDLADPLNTAGTGATNLATGLDEAATSAERVAANVQDRLARGLMTAAEATDILFLRLTDLKAAKAAMLASGDYDPKDLAQLNSDIVLLTNLLNKVNPEVVALGANVEGSAAAWATTGRAADNYSTSLGTLAAMGQAATREQIALDAVLGQLSLNIATEETNRLASAQQLAADNARRATDSWRILKESQDAYAGSARLTVDQTRLLSTVMGDTRTALQEAVNAFAATGDAAQFNADKTEIYRAALDTLYRAGIDPATVGLGKWVTALGESEDKTEAQVQSLKRAEEAAKNYETNLKTLRDVQDALRDGTVGTADAARQMAADLVEAAKGVGKLGEDARKARLELLEFASVVDTFNSISAAAGILSNSLSGINTEGSAFFAGLAESAAFAAENMEDFSGTTSEKINAANGVVTTFADTFVSAMVDSIPESAELALNAVINLGTGIAKLASGDILGGIVAIGAGLADLANSVARSAEEIEAKGKEYAEVAKKYGDDVAQSLTENGNDIAKALTGVDFIDQDKLKEYEDGLAAAEEATKKFVDTQNEFIKKVREGQRELASIYAEMRQSSADLTRDLNDARLDNARASGADEAVIFISETILAIRQASADFHAEMQRITQEKNEFITAYLQANPGATRGEANSAAEKIFGPEREAYREQYVLTTETILLEGQEQAKKLGLSLSEYYEAVFAGNTELLGNMTEGQRLAIVEFVGIARELGIELPKAITDAADQANQAQGEAGESLARGQQEATQRHIDQLKADKEAYQTSFEERKAFLIDKINSTSGETRAAYIGMLQEETAAYEGGLRERNTAINAANEEAANSDVEGLERRREKLKSAYEADKAKLMEGFAEATQLERLEILRRVDELTAAYEEADAQLVSTIEENQDGPGTAIVEAAQKTVDGIQEEIRITNEAWAIRSAELDRLIANSSGVTQQAYIRMKEEEGRVYNDAISGLMGDLQTANQALLDAQDKSSDDFVAAQEEVGRKEQEALNGVFTILRQVLGPDAQLIIDMIQRTYNGRREAYLAEGQATADAAAQSNQGELDSLNSVYETLRQVLGPDAQIIIDMIKRTYEGRQEAYGSGGTATANAAQQSAEQERTSVANINQMLRDIFGPDAQGIIDQILALYSKREKAYREGGAAAGAGAQAGAETERTSIANINQMLRDIFGPEAQGIIDQILALYNKRADVHREGGAEAGSAAEEGGQNAAAGTEAGADAEEQAIVNSDKRVLTAQKRSTADRLAALAKDAVINPRILDIAREAAGNWTQGGELQAQGIAGGTTKITTGLDGRIRALQTGLDRDRNLSPAITAAGQLLSGSFLKSGSDVAQGVLASQGVMTTSIEGRGIKVAAILQGSYTQAISAQGAGSSAQVASIQRAANAEAQQFQAQSQVLLQRISTTKGAERERLIAEYEQLKSQHDAKSQQFQAAIQQGGTKEAGVFTTQAGTKLAAITNGGQRIATGIRDIYTTQVTAQGTGSSNMVTQIQRSYQAEQSKFQAESAEMERRIRTAKGQEKAELQAQYDQMKREHETKSRAYQDAIRKAGADEKSRVADAAKLVVGGLKDMGQDDAEASRAAYEAARKKHESESKLYQALMKRAGDDEKRAAIASAVITSGGLKTMGSNVSSATTTAFTGMKNTFGTQVGQFVDKINDQKDDLESALDKIASVIKNFKYPSLPKPPTIPSIPNKLSGDAGVFAPMTSFAGAGLPEAGAFAANGIPDYAAATGGLRAYAAAATPLLDLFGGSNTLRITTIQERALTIDLRFAGADFARMFERPVAMLERLLDSMWDTARYERDTARFNRETVEMMARTTGRGTRDMLRNPPKRRIE